MNKLVTFESVSLEKGDRIATATLQKGTLWTVESVSEEGLPDRRDSEDSFATREEAIARAYVVWGVK